MRAVKNALLGYFSRWIIVMHTKLDPQSTRLSSSFFSQESPMNIKKAFRFIFKSFFVFVYLIEERTALYVRKRQAHVVVENLEIKWYFIFPFHPLKLFIRGQDINKSWVTLLLIPLFLFIYNLFDSSFRYYGVSTTWIDWTSMIYMILYIPLVFPGSWLLDKLVSFLFLYLFFADDATLLWICFLLVQPKIKIPLDKYNLNDPQKHSIKLLSSCSFLQIGNMKHCRKKYRGNK